MAKFSKLNCEKMSATTQTTPNPTCLILNNKPRSASKSAIFQPRSFPKLVLYFSTMFFFFNLIATVFCTVSQFVHICIKSRKRRRNFRSTYITRTQLLSKWLPWCFVVARDSFDCGPRGHFGQISFKYKQRAGTAGVKSIILHRDVDCLPRDSNSWCLQALRLMDLCCPLLSD